jgi:hypothetical protein
VSPLRAPAVLAFRFACIFTDYLVFSVGLPDCGHERSEQTAQQT